MPICPDCEGPLRVERTYHTVNNTTRHYCQCEACGERHYTETVYGGRLKPKRQKLQYHVNSSSHKWPEIQAALRLQMTQATYDFAIKPMEVIHWHNGLIIISTTPKAKDWAENRLFDTIKRTFERFDVTDDIKFEVNK